MRRSQTLVVSVMVLLTSLGAQTVRGAGLVIATPKERIRYGDPMVLEAKLVLPEPRISSASGRPQRVIKLEDGALRVQEMTAVDSTPVVYRLPTVEFLLQGDSGLEYSAAFVVWCDIRKERSEVIKRLVFDKPGRFELALLMDRDLISNKSPVVVEASPTGGKCLSLLIDPADFEFIASGLKATSQGLSRAGELVEQCKGTVLARLAAARLGLEYFEQFHVKYPSFEEFQAQYTKGEVQEPLLERARAYLTTGAELDDEFPIRAEVLVKLSQTKLIEGKYRDAIDRLDEVGSKYPNTEYGSKVAAWKTEIIGLQSHSGKKTTGTSMNPSATVLSSGRIALWVIGLACIAVVIVVALLLAMRSVLQGKRPSGPSSPTRAENEGRR